MNPLHGRVLEVATAPILLAACDFDGTISHIVEDPAAARPDPEALEALRRLSTLPQTHVAIISGRSLADLQKLVGESDGIELIGSHGCESSLSFAAGLPKAAVQLLDTLYDELSEIASRYAGMRLERKPASVAAHYRSVDPSKSDEVQAAILGGPARRDGVYIRPGKRVIELAVVEMSKGRALQTARYRLAASAVPFFGDDQTDEEAFATMSPPDLAVKVGDGASLAPHAIKDVIEVRELLKKLAAARERFLAQSVAAPIEQHSILSDQRSVAILNPQGRVVWFCLPRIDGAPLFSELLGGAYAGYFAITPADGEPPVGQRYLEDSFVLETRWKNVTVTDYLDCTSGRAFQRAGRTDLTRVIQGSGPITITFAPRIDFGRMATRLIERDGGLEVDGFIDPIVLFSPGVEWKISEQGPHQYATANVELGDEPIMLELRYGTGNLESRRTPEHHRREETHRYWSSWTTTLALPTVRPDLVRRSALVLRALFHGPTGAIAAAATTSLPEHIGGIRNWDYRYCWPRDAAMAASALVRLGTTGQAMKFLDWLLEVLEKCPTPESLAPVYTVAGGHLMPEAEIGSLHGYRGSRPVRIGNLASQQVQLDVFGPITELVALLAEAGAALSSEHWRLVDMMVTAVEHRWQEPDHGIWEIRLSRRHHVHSKAMCWQTVDRALKVAQYLGRKRGHWEGLRDAIAAEVSERGWKQHLRAFSGNYENEHLDAAALTLGISGLLAADDPRFVATVEAVEKELRQGPTVYRYRAEDGLVGVEGGFNLCTAWLIEALVLIGRRDAAMQLFEEYCGLVGPTGLMSEQYDPVEKTALGNFPQAYSHLGLINAALRLSSPN